MAKKRTESDQKADSFDTKLDLIEMDDQNVRELAASVEKIAQRLHAVADEMHKAKLKISAKGMPTWPTLIRRITGTVRSIEMAWDKVNIPTILSDQREKYKSSKKN